MNLINRVVRRAGNWFYQVNIHQFLPNYGADTDEEIVEMIPKIVNELKPLLKEEDLEIDTFEEVLERLEYLSDPRLGPFDLDEFEDVMEQLYDWADSERVWLGI